MFTDHLDVLLSDPDPLGPPVDQEEEDSGGLEAGGAGHAGGEGHTGDVAAVGDGDDIQEETESTWILVATSTIIPVELGLQVEETAPVGLECFGEFHFHP
jgi:hypothetical protein